MRRPPEIARKTSNAKNTKAIATINKKSEESQKRIRKKCNRMLSICVHGKSVRELVFENTAFVAETSDPVLVGHLRVPPHGRGEGWRRLSGIVRAPSPVCTGTARVSQPPPWNSLIGRRRSEKMRCETRALRRRRVAVCKRGAFYDFVPHAPSAVCSGLFVPNSRCDEKRPSRVRIEIQERYGKQRYQTTRTAQVELS